MSVAPPIEHDVLFAESDVELVDVAGHRLAGALAAGDAAIVIATGDHQRELGERIDAAGLDHHTAVSDGSLTMLDAVDTLDRLTPGGAFDGLAFDDVVGSLVRGVSAERRVHAFGEMVALLWDDDRPQEAIELEAAWDRLIRETSTSLLCAYPGRLVDDVGRSAELATVCGLHSSVISDAPFERLWRFSEGTGVASSVRRMVANTMRARGVSEGAFYDTLSVVTELVANAVKHSGFPFSVSLNLDPVRVLVCVGDHQHDRPVTAKGADGGPVRRGLRLVDELASSWGVDRLADGKTVWAELPL